MKESAACAHYVSESNLKVGSQPCTNGVAFVSTMAGQRIAEVGSRTVAIHSVSVTGIAIQVEAILGREVTSSQSF